MSDTDTQQSSSGFSFGFSAALKLWLFFMLSFVFVGYPIPLSIFLGAVGGLAGGVVNAWWKSKDQPSQQKPDASSRRAIKLSGFRLAKRRRDASSTRRLSRKSGRRNQQS